MTKRKCSKCLKVKDLEKDFYRSKRGFLGKSPICKDCSNRIVSDYRKTPRGKEKYLTYVKKFKEKDGYKENHKSYSRTPKGKYRKYVEQAKKKGVPFELSLECLIEAFWDKPCFYCGDQVDLVGIDRIDNSLGYSLTNTVSCCSMCNFMKNKKDQSKFIGQCRKIAENWKDRS
jgi:hypothetical protein